MDKDIVTLSVKHHFDAAHFLRDYKGACSNLHGHRWTVNISVIGKVDPKTGMLIDFKKVKEVIDVLDHKCLNEIIPENPTAENIAKRILFAVKDLIPGTQQGFVRVKLFETPETSVEVQC